VVAVERQTSNGEWEVCTQKVDIEQECIKENIRRFTQANNTPPLLQTQVDLLGWKADTQTALDILQGKENLPEELHENLKNMAPFWKIPGEINNMEPIDCTLSLEEYKYQWKKCKEYTSTGTSGIHFGHFQASCEIETLSRLDCWMAETSLKTGYSLKRWYKGIDVMIPKKADSIKVDKLRTIVLMEADYNFLNKLIGKRVMGHAEKAKTIAPEQFGSRKMKSSINHAVNKQLIIDILQHDRKSFSLMTLDAKGCYD
jgi:Reverse transcriptase (RNA-dependent DNA polymerase)